VKLSRQTVYSKALAIYVAMSFLLGLGVVSFTQAIIVREFRATERREMRVSTERLQMMLERELQSVEDSLTDWLAEPRAREAGPSGLPDAAQMEGLQLDFAAVYDSHGTLLEIIVCHGVEDIVGKTPFDPLGNLIMASSPEIRSSYASMDGQLVGIAWKSAPPLFPKGSNVVVGRLFDDKPLTFLESLLGGKIRFQTLSGMTIGAAGSEDVVTMLAKNEITVSEVSEDEISGSFVLRGLGGPVLGVVSLTQGRPLEEGAQASVRIFLTVLALAGGVLFVAVWFLLDRTILARIHELTHQVEAEEAKGALPVKLEFSGDDELGLLARRIEGLAVLLEKAQSQYRHVVEDQTEAICRFDTDFKLQFSNDAFRRTFHNDDIEPGGSLRSCLPPEAMDFLERRFRRLYPTSPIDTFQHAIELPDAGKLWFRSTLRCNFRPDGTAIGGQWVASDVTPQVEAERGIQDSERQLRQLSNRLLQLQDEERRRIARELHDSTAQSLSALEMNVSLLAPLANDDRTRRIVSETRRIAQDCCQELRNISYLLHPPLLDEVGLTFAARWFIDGYIERTGIQVDLDVTLPFPRLERDVETSLFRVIQEAASNIYRHSGATAASIKLRCVLNEGVFMTIRDNGHGFARPISPNQPARMGIGLAGMRERLVQFGGSLEIKNSPSGVQIDIFIPSPKIHAKV
jgi:signal transduction histidine kinase